MEASIDVVVLNFDGKVTLECVSCPTFLLSSVVRADLQTPRVLPNWLYLGPSFVVDEFELETSNSVV